MNELSVIPDSKELVRQSTDIASLCREIVVASAVVIQRRKYVRVEGWQAIATAHGCVASARDVRKVEGGMVATGEIRRMQDGQLIATAEGFVGEDEPVWYGGEMEKEEWKNNRKTGKMIRVTLPKRPEYAIRAMAQTRAISRACRGCFAHVVVLMDAGLSTTPAEEVPEGGFNDSHESNTEPTHAEASAHPVATPTPEPITEEKAKAGNIAKLRGIFDKSRGKQPLQEYEKAFCILAESRSPNPGTAPESLDGFTLEALRGYVWSNRAWCVSEIAQYEATAKP